MTHGLRLFLTRKDRNFLHLEALTKNIPLGRVYVLINCFAKTSFALIRAFDLGFVSARETLENFRWESLPFPFLD